MCIMKAILKRTGCWCIRAGISGLMNEYSVIGFEFFEFVLSDRLGIDTGKCLEIMMVLLE